MDVTKAKITANGQMSLPAKLRRRWGAQSVVVLDCGDYAIVRPALANPIKSLRGAYAGPGPTSEEMRAEERAADARHEEAVRRLHGW